MSYLGRYLAGEHEQTWDELFALGPAVLKEPLIEDAVAVVRETMGRVRTNIEELIMRLSRAGFIFGYDHLNQQLVSKPSDAGKWQDYLEMRQWSHNQPPVFLPAQFHEELRGEIRALGLADVEEDVLDGTELFPDMKANIWKLDQRVGPLPLALRIWYEQVGAVNFYGYQYSWLKYVQIPTHLMNYCDPLQVYSLDNSLVEHLLEKHRHTPMKHFEFAPDPNFKDNRSGSSTPYDIHWHEAGIDGTLLTRVDSKEPPETFVAYLRRCFQWAGFPGMADWAEVPVEDIRLLTDGLRSF